MKNFILPYTLVSFLLSLFFHLDCMEQENDYAVDYIELESDDVIPDTPIHYDISDILTKKSSLWTAEEKQFIFDYASQHLYNLEDNDSLVISLKYAINAINESLTMYDDEIFSQSIVDFFCKLNETPVQDFFLWTENEKSLFLNNFLGTLKQAASGNLTSDNTSLEALKTCLLDKFSADKITYYMNIVRKPLKKSIIRLLCITLLNKYDTSFNELACQDKNNMPLHLIVLRMHELFETKLSYNDKFLMIIANHAFPLQYHSLEKSNLANSYVFLLAATVLTTLIFCIPFIATNPEHLFVPFTSTCSGLLVVLVISCVVYNSYNYHQAANKVNYPMLWPQNIII